MASTKYLPKYGRQGNLMTYFFDYATLSIKKTQLSKGEKAAYSSSQSNIKITKNYWGITLIAIVVKVYNVLLLNHIKQQLEKSLKKQQSGFQTHWLTSSQILTLYQIIEGVNAKHFEATLLFVNFSKSFDSIHRGKIEQILLAYGLPTQMVTALIFLYKNTKAMVHSSDGDSNFFNIAGVLQGKLILGLAKLQQSIHTHTHTHTHIYIHIYVYIDLYIYNTSFNNSWAWHIDGQTYRWHH